MSLRLSLFTIASPLFGALLLAQTNTATPAACPDDNSLAAVACRNKAQKLPKAKKVVTDEDLDRIPGPLPSLNMNTADNGDEVIAAIHEYKKDHTPQETEDAVRQVVRQVR